ncbi:MAG: glycosylhydrolase-like jelly roll fold domain-containing protein [Saccharofermentanales bacterium]
MANIDFMIQLNEPAEEFTPIPMWFWNDNLEQSEIRRQIKDFYDHEIYGFMIHPRMGIPRDIPYLSDVYMDYIEYAVEMAEEYGMKVYLYDEAMYPSGSAHGQVVEADPRFAAQVLVRRPAIDGKVDLMPFEKLIYMKISQKSSEESGTVAFIQTRSGGKIRGIHFGEDSSEPGAPAAADLLNPDSTACFIRLTHERYYARLARYFGSTVLAFFTDEPSLTGRGMMEGKIPWTDGMLEICIKNGILPDDLDALFSCDSGTDKLIREKYAAICQSRLSETYYEPISRWCSQHEIALTGHPSHSDDIGLLKYFQIPGQDLVLRRIDPENDTALTGRDSTLAKCAADAARHAGRRRNAVECFGCCVRNNPSTGWDLPPEDMKWYIDWMSIRGVNLFFPHAFYYSLNGKRAYERPPDVGPAQTWWSEYSIWSRYMRRISCLMTDSVSLTEIAVLCTGSHMPYKVTRPLYENQLDFNYLEERYLTDEKLFITVEGLEVGNYRYTTIIVEDPSIFSSETLKVLGECALKGIKVLYPDLHDFVWIQMLIDKVPVRTVSHRPDLRLTCQKKNGYQAVLLVNEGRSELCFELDCSLPGYPILWDPWIGSFYRLDFTRLTDEKIRIPLQLKFRQSLVIIFTENDENTITNNFTGILPALHFRSCECNLHGAEDLSVIINLSDDWKVFFPEIKSNFIIDKLSSWNDILQDTFYSGHAVYEKSFYLNPPLAKELVLDLGEVYEVAAIILNGKKLDTLFWPPYRIDVSEFLTTGTNTLKIDLMNSISCRMDRIARTSGLLGPVKIISEA